MQAFFCKCGLVCAFLLFWGTDCVVAAETETVLTETDLQVLETVKGNYVGLRNLGDKLFREGELARAYAVYSLLEELDISRFRRKIVEFRLAEIRWKLEDTKAEPDVRVFAEARNSLQSILLKLEEEGEVGRRHPGLWAFVHESIGDSFWVNLKEGSPRVADWEKAWYYYEKSLDWIAGSTNIQSARSMYLDLVWKISREKHYSHSLPVEVLEHVIEIAEEQVDDARAYFLLAMALLARDTGDGLEIPRMEHAFELAVSIDEPTSWLDQALFEYARLLSPSLSANKEADNLFPIDVQHAQKLYEKLTTLYTAESSDYYEEAKRAQEELSRKLIDVSADSVFLPGESIRVSLSWRNVPRVDVSFYAIDLEEKIKPQGDRESWINELDFSGLEPVYNINKERDASQLFALQQDVINIDEPFVNGAYIVEVKGDGVSDRDLVLVSDVELVVDSSATEITAYLCDAITGEPVEDVVYTMWEQSSMEALEEEGRSSDVLWRVTEKVEKDQNIVRFQRKSDGDFMLIGSSESRVAYTLFAADENEQVSSNWKVFVETDRPAYRGSDLVGWKIVVRQNTPSGLNVVDGKYLHFSIFDGGKNRVHAGRVILNRYGSAWGDFPLNKEFVQGDFYLVFSEENVTSWKDWMPHFSSGISDTVFGFCVFRVMPGRLEDLSVQINPGRGSFGIGRYTFGDNLRGSIMVSRDQSGTVSSLRGEIVIYRRELFEMMADSESFDWFYQSENNRNSSELLVKREQLTLDSDGVAQFHMETARQSSVDYVYTINVNFVDGGGNVYDTSKDVYVTRRGFEIKINTGKTFYEMGDQVDMRLLTQQFGGKMIATSGRLILTKEVWSEEWIDKRGRIVSKKKLSSLWKKAGGAVNFKRQPGPYELKREGYESRIVHSGDLNTSVDGVGVFHFNPEDSGYYKIRWSGRDQKRRRIAAEAYFWVIEDGRDFGYRPDRLTMVVDRLVQAQSGKVRVLLAAPEPNASVLFCMKDERSMLSSQLVKLKGRAGLIEVDIGKSTFPYRLLNAQAVMGRERYATALRLNVPPTNHFLDISIQTESIGYKPLDDVNYEIQVKDGNGNPVQAELSFLLIGGDNNEMGKHKRDQMDLRRFFYLDRARLGQRYSYGLSQSSLQDPMDTLGGGEPASLSTGRDTLRGAVRSGAYIMAKTAHWEARLETDAKGVANVKIRYPNELSKWTAVVTGMTSDSFGLGEHQTETRTPLIANFHFPDYISEGDELRISSVIDNNTARNMEVDAVLQAKNIKVDGVLNDESGELVANKKISMNLLPKSSKRALWQLSYLRPGGAELELDIAGKVNTQMRGALQSYLSMPGVSRSIAGSMKGGAVHSIGLNMTEEEIDGEAFEIELQTTPSVSIAVLDALAGLFNKQVVSTEHFIGSIVPLLKIRETLAFLGLSAEAIDRRVEGAISVKGGEPMELSKRFDLLLNQFYGHQKPNGSWAWLPYGEGDPFMSALSGICLSYISRSGVAVDAELLARTKHALLEFLKNTDIDNDIQAWILYALAVSKSLEDDQRPSQVEADVFLNLMKNRDLLSADVIALLALSAHGLGFGEDAALLVEKLGSLAEVKRTAFKGGAEIFTFGESGENSVDVAFWNQERGVGKLYSSNIAVTALVLYAILEINPNDPLVEPAVHWLLMQREGPVWGTFFETTLCALALDNYVLNTAEIEVSTAFSIKVNDKVIAEHSVTLDNLLAVPSRFQIRKSLLKAGENKIEITKQSGKSSIFFAAFATARTGVAMQKNEEVAVPSIATQKISRNFYRITTVPTLLKGLVEHKTLLEDDASVLLGDRIEVVHRIECADAIEYFVLNAVKGSGFDVDATDGVPLVIYARELNPLTLQNTEDAGSIINTGSYSTRYTERRRIGILVKNGPRLKLFFNKLPEGSWEIRYTLKVNHAGRFYLAPTRAYPAFFPNQIVWDEEVYLQVDW